MKFEKPFYKIDETDEISEDKKEYIFEQSKNLGLMKASKISAMKECGKFLSTYEIVDTEIGIQKLSSVIWFLIGHSLRKEKEEFQETKNKFKEIIEEYFKLINDLEDVLNEK